MAHPGDLNPARLSHDMLVCARTRRSYQTSRLSKYHKSQPAVVGTIVVCCGLVRLRLLDLLVFAQDERHGVSVASWTRSRMCTKACVDAFTARI